MQEKLKKHIRSFVKRHRKLSPNQQHIFDKGSKIYCTNKTFTNNAPLALEIGFGMGVTLFNYVTKYPDINFIGVEIHQPGIVSLFRMLQNTPVNNLHVYNDDVITVLNHHITNNSLDKILIFFPDPWPKKRHNKRRMIQVEFLQLIHKKMKNNGILHIATDWEDYANHIVNTTENITLFTALESSDSEFLKIVADRASSKFEQRGMQRGHKIFDLIYRANNDNQ